MANAIAGASQAQHAARLAQAAHEYQSNKNPKQNTNRTAAPQDTVTISRAAQEATSKSGPNVNGGERSRE
jgi:hypothetical protein